MLATRWRSISLAATTGLLLLLHACLGRLTDKNACSSLPLPFTYFYECPSASDGVQPAHLPSPAASNANKNSADANVNRATPVGSHWSNEIEEPCTSQLERGGCPKTAPLYPTAGAQCQMARCAKRPVVAKYPLAKSLRSLAFIFLCECCFLIALNSFLL